MGRVRLLVLLALMVGTTACDYFYKDQPYWCPGLNPNNNCLDGIDLSCESNDECTPLVCDLTGSRLCVECTAADSGACVGETPVCGSDNECRGCVAHAECDSKACLPAGSCAASDQVAYVTPSSPSGTDAGGCTLATPCLTLARALDTGRPYVKIEGTVNDRATVTDRHVTLLSEPGSRLTSTLPGPLLWVDGTSWVAIYDLEISGASDPQSGFGIVAFAGSAITLVRVKLSENRAGGLSATNSTLMVSQSTISGNAGGGIVANGGVFVIVGNVFFKNGSNITPTGGIKIDTAPSVTNRLEFNSFNSNKTQDGAGAGIACVAGTFTARNNIISENGTPTSRVQISGTCMHSYSIVHPGPVPPGPNNSGADPLFQNTETGDLHLRPGSLAIDAADPRSILTGIVERDIDGDKRSAPADIGADEAR